MKRSNAHVDDARVGLTAVNPAPLLVKGASELLAGKTVDKMLADAVGDLAARVAKPLTTSALTPDYRREMIRVFTRRAVLEAAEVNSRRVSWNSCQEETMARYHIAQVNIGRVKAPVEDPSMAAFTMRLDEINALADASPGFVWRLQTSVGNATYFRPYDDDKVLLNMSVWETIEDFRHYVYHTVHAELLRHRHEWFEKFAGTYTALWWVPAGHRPSIDEAKKRLAHLEEHGPTEFAFTFKSTFQPDERFQQGIDWSSFQPCPAT